MNAIARDPHVSTSPATRLNAQELAFKQRLDGLPEFAMCGYQTGEMRTFRGIVIRKGGSVRGLWSYADGHYRWLPVSCNSETYVTAIPDRALRHMMLLVLKQLLVRRAVRRTPHVVEADVAATDRIYLGLA